MTKKELAFQYSPDCTYGAAINRLTRWIEGDLELRDALHQAGYRETQRSLTPKQVTIIYDYLGDPTELN